ncbi:hypothetical protein AB4134_25200, partial [Vibrio lentus]
SSEPLMLSLVLLAQRWNFLNEQIKALEKVLKKLTLNIAQSLVSRFGVGANVAATLLVAAGDNANRLRKESSRLLHYVELIRFLHLRAKQLAID